MQASNRPSKIQLPFANAGTKNTIPVASQIGVTPGKASFTDGFPPLTFTPLASGGVPPSGADFNGVLNAITAIQQWQSAGGGFAYDAAWSTANSGYPKGAVLANVANDGYWINLTDGNTTDPDSGTAANWYAVDSSGIASVAGLTNANVTLTPAQYGKSIVILTGALTGNVQITFPTLAGTQWLVLNNTTGAFATTCKTAAGTGAQVVQGGSTPLWGDGTNLNAALPQGGVINVQVITATGTYTPTAGMKTAIIEVQGGGGGGGGSGATGAGQVSLGGGGASGSYAKGRFTAAQIGASQAVTIGAAGAGGVAGANAGSSGGTTSLGALLSAPGGGGGTSLIPSASPNMAFGGPPGLVASGGNLVNSAGMPGGTAIAAGLNVSGYGAGSPIAGGGGGGVPATAAVAGSVAKAPGAGGSGARTDASDIARAGGSGAAGIIIVWEFA